MNRNLEAVVTEKTPTKDDQEQQEPPESHMNIADDSAGIDRQAPGRSEAGNEGQGRDQIEDKDAIPSCMDEGPPRNPITAAGAT